LKFEEFERFEGFEGFEGFMKSCKVDDANSREWHKDAQSKEIQYIKLSGPLSLRGFVTE